MRNFDYNTSWEDVKDMTIEEAIYILSRDANSDGKEWQARPHKAKAAQIAIDAMKRMQYDTSNEIIPDNKTNEMKKCPFCGGNALLEKYEMSPYEKVNIDNNDGMFYEIYCDNCYAVGPTCLTEIEAISKWNNRVVR